MVWQMQTLTSYRVTGTLIIKPIKRLLAELETRVASVKANVL